MTDREKAIIMAYTGICMLAGDKFRIFHEYVEDIMGRPVYTHEIGLLADTIKEKAEADFMALCADGSSSEIPNKWTPASEPPKKEGKYLVCIEYKHKGVVVERYQMTADFYRFSHIDMSWCPDNENAAGDIVAWRELPEPYKAESEEE